MTLTERFNSLDTEAIIKCAKAEQGFWLTLVSTPEGNGIQVAGSDPDLGASICYLLDQPAFTTLKMAVTATLMSSLSSDEMSKVMEALSESH